MQGLSSPTGGKEPKPLAEHSNAKTGDFSEDAHGALFVDGVSPEDVIQSNINDCYFVATLASVAKDNPQFIKDMIKPTSSGYEVRFYLNGKEHWVPVSSKLPQKQKSKWQRVKEFFGASEQPPETLYAYSEDTNEQGQRETWAAVVEKAYAQYQGDLGKSGDYADVDWGHSSKAYEALFGTSGNEEQLGPGTKSQDTWDDLTKALDTGQPVVASTGAHVISVLGYDESGGTKMVEIRDQAKGSDDDQGVETITIDEFLKRYTYFRSTDLPDASQQKPPSSSK